MHRQSTATRVTQEGARRVGLRPRRGLPARPGRAGAAYLAGRPTRGARPAPPPAAGVGSGARACSSEKRQRTEAADGRARRRKQGAAGPRARAARGVPARGVHRTATHARGVPRARRLGRGATRMRGGGGAHFTVRSARKDRRPTRGEMIHTTHTLRALLGCGGESRQTARPTQRPRPRRAGVARRDASWTRARSARSGERREAARRRRRGPAARREHDNDNDGPARDNDSHLDVRKSSAHAERRASAARHRSAWASASSRPPRFENALRAAAGRRGSQPVFTYRVAVDGRGRMGRVGTTRPR